MQFSYKELEILHLLLVNSGSDVLGFLSDQFGVVDYNDILGLFDKVGNKMLEHPEYCGYVRMRRKGGE